MKILNSSAVLLASILLIGIGICDAKDPVPSGAEIAAIESAYLAVDDLTADFTQETKIELLDRTVLKRGTFRFKKGGKLRIEYADKGGKHYVSDGTTLWTFVPGDDASLDTFSVDERNVPREALSFLGGFGRLTKEFKVSGSAAFKEARPGETALTLVPRRASAQYESLEALFGADRLLRELVVKNVSGNVSRYSFKEIRTNSGLPDRLFTLSSGKA
ncbi:MAG: outer membrane lipoprotein carrier protein LolA, partial [Proteobacteria bacterium]|nr:outer membrane lipoprotein carrier protein LolA [Pseudomonadota bacterium]